MQPDASEKVNGHKTPVEKLWKSCGNVENSVNPKGKLSLLALREAGGLQFFHPGHPLWRHSGIHQREKNASADRYQSDLGWAAKCAANAHGPDWVKQHIPMEGPIVLGITVFRKGPPTNKPDLDNYLKLVADAMTRARIYIDDAHIVEYFPGTCKRDSKVEGMRVILVPQCRMAALGFGDVDGI